MSHNAKIMSPQDFKYLNEDTPLDFLPQKINNKNVYVEIWTRLMAVFVDAILFISLYFILFIILKLYSSLSEDAQLHLTTNLFIFGSGIGSYLYDLIFYSVYGATLGDRAVGIVISRPNGDRVGFTRILVLVIGEILIQVSIGSLFELFTDSSWVNHLGAVIWGVGNVISIIFTKQKRRLIDFIAGTVYMYKDTLTIDPINSDDSPKSLVSLQA